MKYALNSLKIKMEKIKRNLKASLAEETWEKVRKIYLFRKFYRLASFELNHDHRNSIILAGSGRSGTTWIANIINYNNEYRLMFEPFHPDYSEIGPFIKEYPYIRVYNDDPLILALADDILAGRARSIWINKYNRKIFSSKRIIKAIYANLLLPWLHQRFSDIPMILLLRHPCAVALSRLRLGWWDPDRILDRYLGQKELAQDYLKDIPAIRYKEYSEFEKYIIIWCIENMVPLSQLGKDEIHIAFFENFCKRPEDEIRKLFTFLKKDVDTDIFRHLDRPSQVVHKRSAIIRGEDTAASWKKYVSQEQIEKALRILKIFGLDLIYSDFSFPDEQGLQDYMDAKL